MRKSVIRGVTKSESDVDDSTKSPTNTEVNTNSSTGTVIRPQTRVIRRPTPHLKHPIISESGKINQDRSCKRREKSENRIKSFHDRFLTHNPLGKAKSLDPTPTIKIDTCKSISKDVSDYNIFLSMNN